MGEKYVVMAYTSPNNYSCTVMPIEEAKKKFKDFKINPKKKTWSWREWKNIPIGRARSIYTPMGFSRFDEGIIGVYNAENIKHLDRMVHDAVEFHKPEPGPYDD